MSFSPPLWVLPFTRQPMNGLSAALKPFPGYSGTADRDV